jgi:hypothetical protein
MTDIEKIEPTLISIEWNGHTAKIDFVDGKLHYEGSVPMSESAALFFNMLMANCPELLASRFGMVSAFELEALRSRAEKAEAERDAQSFYKNAAYAERNKLVRLLASIYPSGIKKTAIDGWDEAWHWCVYIDMPGFQASWHFHESDLPMFSSLPHYPGEWDGHTTDEKYACISDLAIALQGMESAALAQPADDVEAAATELVNDNS